MKRALIGIGLVLVLGASTHVWARGNAAAGAQKSQVCQACHGVDGNGVGDPQYPIIAGQYADYLEHTLRKYRDGRRKNAIMQGFASTLSDQDIRDLAAYFAAQKSKLHDLSHVKR